MPSNANSEANRKKWKALSKEEKRARLAPATAARWKGVSDRKKKAHARKMHAARWGDRTD